MREGQREREREREGERRTDRKGGVMAEKPRGPSCQNAFSSGFVAVGWYHAAAASNTQAM